MNTMTIPNGIRVLLLVEQERLRSVLVEAFARMGCDLHCGRNVSEAVRGFADGAYDFAFVEDSEGLGDSVPVIKQLADANPLAPIVSIRDLDGMEGALESIRLGAWDCVPDDGLSDTVLETVVQRCLRRAQRIESGRNRISMAARQNEALIESLLEHSPAVVYVKDLDGKIVRVNRQYERIFGLTKEQIVGKTEFELFPAEMAARWRKNDLEIIESRMAVQFEETAPHTDGVHAYVSVKFPLFDDQGAVIGVGGISTDITPRKQAEEALQSSERRLREAQEIGKMGSYVYEIAADRWASSEELDRLFGIGPDYDRSVDGWVRLIIPEDRDMALGSLRVSIEYQVRFDIEYRIVRPSDGQQRWLHAVGELEYNEQRKPVRLIGTNLDITERKLTEAERTRLLAIVDECPDFIGVADMQGNLKYHNRAARRMVGLADDHDLSGRKIGDMHPEWASRQVLDIGVPTVLKHGSWQCESAVLHRDGTEIPVSQLLMLHRDLDGQPILLSTIMRDITAPKRLEQALRESQQFLERTGAAANVGGWELDLATKTLVWTEQTRRIHEVPVDYRPTVEQAIEFYAPEARPVVRQAVDEGIRNGTPWDLELPFVTGTGRHIWVRSVGEIYRHEGKVVRIGGAIQDITARKLAENRHRDLEAQLRQSQKMEAVGQLSGGVAHDFNNLLSVINGNLSIIEWDGKFTAEQLEGISEIKLAVDRAASLTRQLLAFSRRQTMETRNLNLNELVENMSKLIRRILGEDVQMQVHFMSHPALVRADTGMIEQVLLNLVVNARDAMPTGGRLVIELSQNQFDATSIEHLPQARAGAFVTLSVTDTGCGIPTQNIPRIFEPFFTTKDVGKGTGLGLATVYGIVQQHQGWVNVYSEVGKGTTFRVYLPSLAATALPCGTTERARELPKGSETILLVEDEPALRALVRKLLTRLGYRVIEASNGVEAMKLWETHGSTIDLLFTDLVMPDGISGRELARRLLEHHPRLKIIYASGYSPEIAGKNLSLLEGRNFLAKPYDHHKLAVALRDLLDGK
ncbi:MAG TPA: PAS domain S-box protein [Candidatus Limnocylindria bacterium]|jgi:PAS domain S-box-containing protein|nr:PAS domain S-box protein [Candidatus Limnocylindria bacterium]